MFEIMSILDYFLEKINFFFSDVEGEDERNEKLFVSYLMLYGIKEK